MKDGKLTVETVEEEPSDDQEETAVEETKENSPEVSEASSQPAEQP